MKLPCIVLAVVAWTAGAADLPQLVIPEGVGVNIHFSRGHEADLDLMAKAGFKWVRMDLGWSGIERVKGQYDWSAYDELTRNLARRQLRALYILDYSNPIYEDTVVTRNPVTGREQRDTASPQHPESVAAFARWAAAAAARYRGDRVILEMWNEPNITFWKPKPDVRQYNELVLATCRAIRAADPQATLIGPATSEIPLPFLDAHFASGVLEYLDAVSVHPYRNYAKSPETVGEEYPRLRELISKYAPPDRRTLPIISGEWGYASHTLGVTHEVQAAFAARQQLINLLHGVPLSIWYDWKNDGPDPAEREHNFGVVTAALDPKPAWHAIRVLTSELEGYRLARRLGVGGPDDYVLLFERADRPAKLAAWTVADSRPVSIPVAVQSKASVRAVNLRGPVAAIAGEPDRSATQPSVPSAGSSGPPVRLDDRRLTVQLDQHPLYLTLDGLRPMP